MRRDLMPRISNLSNQVRIRLGHPPQHKKSPARPKAVQQLQHATRVPNHAPGQIDMRSKYRNRPIIDINGK